MKKTSQNCKIDYFTCSLGRKINFLKCGDNEGPVATFVAILVKVLDTADLDDSKSKVGEAMLPQVKCIRT